MGFPWGAGGHDGGDGGEKDTKDQEFCHDGEETKKESASTCQTTPSYKKDLSRFV